MTGGRLTTERFATALGGALDGVLSEYVVFPEHGLVRLPDHLSFVEAATLPCAGVTAWHALTRRGVMAAGETVLLLGTGTVSLFALQFAKTQGLKVIITSSSDAKLERARAHGADMTINYRDTPGWSAAAREMTGGRGVDLVVEVGGPGTLGQSMQAVRMGGRISLTGALAGFGGEVNPIPILANSLQLDGIYVGSGEMFEDMNRALTAHALRPVVDRVFPFAHAREAYRAQKEPGDRFGNVVVAFDQ